MGGNAGSTVTRPLGAKPARNLGDGDRPCNVVLSGGAVSGVALVGALQAFVEVGGYNRFSRVAGTSAGAVVGCVVAAGSAKGKTAADIVKLLQQDLDEADFSSFVDGQGFLNPFALGHLLALNKGEVIKDWLRKQLQTALDSDKEPTFGALNTGNRGAPAPLTVFACDISSGQLVALPRDVNKLYALNADDFSIVTAVRASMAVPFFFDPVVVENGKDKSSSMLVDGGMVSNFPIGFLPSSGQGEPWLPTFGVLLSERTPFKDAANIKNFINVGESLVNFLENFYDDASLADPEVRKRVVEVPPMKDGDGEPISGFDFNLTPEKKEIMRDYGYNAAKAMFDRHPELKWPGPPDVAPAAAAHAAS